MKNARIEVTGERDALGRARFTMWWTERPGVYRRELHADGKPVGYRRAQIFRMNVESFVAHLRAKGVRVKVVELAVAIATA